MQWLRLAGIAIAVMAVVDPAITSTRESRPVVSVVASSPQDATIAEHVEKALDRTFTVVRGALAGAAGTVLVGNALPDDAVRLPAPVIAIAPERPVPDARIIALDVPAEVPVNARVPIEVQVAIHGAQGRTLAVELRANGIVVDADSTAPSVSDARATLSLDFVPASAGTSQVEIITKFNGSAVDSAMTIVDVRDVRYRVLFFDLRPSWQSTFVRRAVEADPRFIVEARTRTSRGIANVLGTPPSSLGDDVLDDYTVVVIGSPDELASNEVRALDRYLRERGGRVVVLHDGRVTASLNQLTGVTRWRSTTLTEPVTLNDSSGGTLRARELVWPATNPAGLQVHASRTAGSDVQPMLWSIPVGAGRVFVSGAADAWHHRDPGSSKFDQVWPSILSALSASAPKDVEVSIRQRVLAPAKETSVDVAIRDVAIGRENMAAVRAMMIGERDTSFIRLWPTTERGTMRGRVVAPATSGMYRLAVTAGRATENVSLLVDPAASEAELDETPALAAFASSRGGFTIAEPQLSDLPTRLSAALRPASRVETWHPMRSAWWLLPFTLFLGAEWWWRRRRGLA